MTANNQYFIFCGGQMHVVKDKTSAGPAVSSYFINGDFHGVGCDHVKPMTSHQIKIWSMEWGMRRLLQENLEPGAVTVFSDKDYLVRFFNGAEPCPKIKANIPMIQQTGLTLGKLQDAGFDVKWEHQPAHHTEEMRHANVLAERMLRMKLTSWQNQFRDANVTPLPAATNAPVQKKPAQVKAEHKNPSRFTETGDIHIHWGQHVDSNFEFVFLDDGRPMRNILPLAKQMELMDWNDANNTEAQVDLASDRLLNARRRIQAAIVLEAANQSINLATYIGPGI